MKISVCWFILIAASAPAISAAETFRPPAAPLVTVDPYFSIWSMTDRLYDDSTRHWTGKPQPLSSLIRVDGSAYRLMGKDPDRVPPMPQTSLQVHPTRTMYTFEAAGVKVTLTFATPLLMNDLDLFSRPVTYLRWKAEASDGKTHRVEVYFDAADLLTVNTGDQTVNAARLRIAGHEVLRAGSAAQPILGRSGDDLRIDWGYLYLGAASKQAPASIAESIGNHEAEAAQFIANGQLVENDDFDLPKPAGRAQPALALRFDLGRVDAGGSIADAAIAYDDLFSIEYFNRRLRPYWRRNGADASDLIQSALSNADSVLAKCDRFDEALEADLEKSGGRAYVVLGSLAYRQALAAQKLVVDADGTPMLFPKENFSNGCIGTVDVLYPQAPQLMLFNTELLKASITPVLEYAGMARWKFPFAPHDLGQYPLANGQVYGGGEKTEDDQMPVEESANMILLVAAAVRPDATAAYAERYWNALSKWARYLREKGLDPENQLCTDDFAGHLAHNVNLSAKAIEALGAYSDLCNRTGRSQEAADYRKIAEQFAQRWMRMAEAGGHYRLAFDAPDTWSQKYNLVWDKLLDLHLFPRQAMARELAFYLSQMREFGLPLDNRKTYTKLDWTFWTATMADTNAEFEKLIQPLYKWANETTSRVPMTDWYDTVGGKQEAFQARSVVGGLFIKLLADPGEQKKWNAGGRR